MRWRTAAFRRCRDYFACGDLRLAVERKEGSDGDQRPGRPVAAARSRLPGPARENDVRVELRGLQPVPGPERYGRPFRIFKMWLSPQFTPSALFIGVLTASLGLSFGQGLPAIVTGNITGALVVAALCTRGPRTGMGQMPLSRAAFRKSDVLPGVVNWASAIGWVAFNNVFGALGVLAMIAIYLATVAADIVNDYAGSLSLQAAGITVRRPAIALINSAAAFGFSAWFLYVPGALYDKVENLLLFFTYWISAWLGVVVVDWVRRRGRVCVAELRDFGKLRWSALALIAFVAGSPPRSHSPTPPPGMTSPPATRRSRTWPATSRSARCTRPTSGTFSRSRSPRCCTGRGRAAPPRHANPGNPAVTAAPAGGKPDGQPGRDAREGGAKVHDRTGLRPLPPGRPGCATAGLPSTEVDCLPAHAEMTIVRWVCWSETSGLWIRSFQELVVPSAAVISWTASASAGLTLCPSSLCAAATLLASARTKCR
jgi:hypothetical protein